MNREYDTYAWFYGGNDLSVLRKYFSGLRERGSRRERRISNEKNMDKDIYLGFYYFKLKKSALMNLEFKDDIGVMYRNYLYPRFNVKKN